jgi:hypothetical protein
LTGKTAVTVGTLIGDHTVVSTWVPTLTTHYVVGGPIPRQNVAAALKQLPAGIAVVFPHGIEEPVVSTLFRLRTYSQT